MKYQDLVKVSDPEIVYRQFINLYPPESHIKVSNRSDKKFKIFNPHTQKYFHFGSACYSDFTKHKDLERRERYLARASKIKGNWKNNIYSANFASIVLLWNGFNFLKEKGLL
jgi:hypothetical protein